MFRVDDLGMRVEFVFLGGVEDSGFRIGDLGFRVEGYGLRVETSFLGCSPGFRG